MPDEPDAQISAVTDYGGAQAEPRSSDGGPSKLSPIATLRREVLEHLVELWYSQDETLRLAHHWMRYERLVVEARSTAFSLLESNDGNLVDGISAALTALRTIDGLTPDQLDYAMTAAIRDRRPEQPDDDGYAVAALRRVRKRRKDMGLLSAQLVSLVADFEVFVLRITTAWLRFNSDHLAGRKKELTFKEISELGSVEELQESIVQSFLEDHMRKSATAWFGEFCKLFGVQSIEGMKDFATLEVFQRRHVIVHHGGLVSAQYLEALSDFKLSVDAGDDLPVDLDYIKRAGDALACVAHSIAMSALVAASASDQQEREETESEIGELTYILLTLRRNAVVERFVSKFDLKRVGRQFAREQIRVNGWIARRRLGKQDEVKAEVAGWDTSASADSFALAKLVLLGEDPAAIAMAVRMISENRLSMYSVATWPLFEDINGEILDAVEADDEGEPEGGSDGEPAEGGPETPTGMATDDVAGDPREELAGEDADGDGHKSAQSE